MLPNPKRRKIATESGGTSSYISTNAYEVFLSFRGPDTRQSLADCLYHAMMDAGIRVFRDDDELRPGDKIDTILEAIDNSKVCVPVLSRTFASSAWCLREVERMVKMNKEIMPIFFDVTPNDVKLNTELYADALTAHEAKYEKEQVLQWRKALKEIPKFKGRELKEQGFADFSMRFAKEILTKLKLRQKFEMKNLVETPDEVEKTLELLDIESGGRRFVGIHGMGGIGKTTLAKLVFDKIFENFDCSAFLENVRISWEDGKGLHHLQKQLLEALDPTSRTNDLKRNFMLKKVLIVLDDVDQRDQIDNLVGDSRWFGFGSRIIITSRNARVLEDKSSTNVEFYALEKKEMDPQQARELFSKHAFGQDFPPDDYEHLSEEAISTTGGLPLALEVVGSFLYRRRENVWRSTIKKLKESPEKAVQKKLKLSYDALDREEQEIFLDISCFFIGKEKTEPIYMWEACGFYPDYRIDVLISLSLIKIKDEKHLWMHDQLRDMGRAIVKEHSKDPREGSRLWMHEQAVDLLRTNMGKEKVEGISLTGSCWTWTREDLASFRKLRYLQLADMKSFEGDFDEQLLPKLRWLSIYTNRSSCFRLNNLFLSELVILDLWGSGIDRAWQGWSQILILCKLKVLKLKDYQGSVPMPDLGRLVNLERLMITYCFNLKVLPDSLGDLKSLVELVLDFTAITELPSTINRLVNLERLSLWRCHLRKLPDSLGDLKSLVELILDSTPITELPRTISRLAKLERLSLRQCHRLEVLPDSLGDLKSLVKLDLTKCARLKGLPNSLGNLQSLMDLRLRGAKPIVELPDSITKLGQLKVLDIAWSSITKFPDSLGLLTSFTKLRLEGSNLTSLPGSSGDLEKLNVLTVGNPATWIDLHELPTGLTELSIQNVRKIPDLSGLSNLAYLAICNEENGQSVEQLDHWNFKGIGKLTRLMKLKLQSSKVKSIPLEFSDLTRLRELTLHCPNLEFMPPRLPSSLRSLELVVKRSQVVSDLCNLKKLSSLRLAEMSTVEGDIGVKRLGFEELESLEDLSIDMCTFELNELPQNLRRLHVCGGDSLRTTLPDLSRLETSLESLTIRGCHALVDIPGIRNLKSLRHLEIACCGLLERIENLSSLERLEHIIILDCANFKGVEGLDGLSPKTVWIQLPGNGLP